MVYSLLTHQNNADLTRSKQSSNMTLRTNEKDAVDVIVVSSQYISISKYITLNDFRISEENLGSNMLVDVFKHSEVKSLRNVIKPIL